MTEYRMTITDEAAASMAASIIGRKKQQVAVLHGIMRDLTVLGESHRHGTVTARVTVQALDEMFELLQDLALELTNDLSKEKEA